MLDIIHVLNHPLYRKYSWFILVDNGKIDDLGVYNLYEIMFILVIMEHGKMDDLGVYNL